MKITAALAAACALLLVACGDKEDDDGGCTYVDMETASCTWTSTDGVISLEVTGDDGTSASTTVPEETTCYADSPHGLDEAFDCTLQELDEGGCDPDVNVVDLGDCSLEVY